MSSSAPSTTSPGLGITGGYEGDSLALKVVIAFLLGLSMYNVVELQILIFGTFNKFRGLYFWSLVISSLGIIPYSLGFIFKYFSILTGGAKWFSIFLLSIGWYPMVTGQSVVLWSRLHLIVTGEKGDKILLYTKWMIIINAIVLHIPTTVLTCGSNSDTQTMVFVRGYNIMEKIQMCGFFLQEIILSSIYINETIRILRTSVQANTKRLMYQLMAINILIIIMDLALLGLECASLYILETTTKPVFYSIKLKLEFAILGKLVHFVGPRGSQNRASITFSDQEKNGSQNDRSYYGGDSNLGNMNDISEFVDLSKVESDAYKTSQPSGQSHNSALRDYNEMDIDMEIARMEHLEKLPTNIRPQNGTIMTSRQRKKEQLERNYEGG